MNSDSKTRADAAAAHDAAREAWVKPEIVSFEPIEATKSNTVNPGDNFSSNS